MVTSTNMEVELLGSRGKPYNCEMMEMEVEMQREGDELGRRAWDTFPSSREGLQPVLSCAFWFYWQV